MARDEAMLVAQAAELGFEDFYRVLDYWKQMADPDGADASEEERKASRNVFLESSLSGMWLGQMTLDPISGSIVAGELNRLEHDLFEADCAQAKERLGRTGRIDELARTSGQRRADALVEMATRSRTAPADGIRPAPLFSVSSSATRRCTGASASSRTAPCSHPRPSTRGWTRPTSSGPCSPWATGSTSACGPGSSPVGPAGPSSCGTGSAPTPIAMSPPRTARPTTSRPTPQVGLTTQENGRLLCGFHNRLRNQKEHPGDQRQRPPPTAA